MAFTDDSKILLIGPIYTITQNVTMISPGRMVRMYVQAGAAIEQSNDSSTWDAVTLDDDEGFDLASAFVRTTAATAIVRLVSR